MYVVGLLINGRCLHSHCLAMGLYATIYSYDGPMLVAVYVNETSPFDLEAASEITSQQRCTKPERHTCMTAYHWAVHQPSEGWTL
jgi:hypothetical protein